MAALATSSRAGAVAISNPKALLLFAALLPQFTDTTAAGANVNIALLGAAYVGVLLQSALIVLFVTNQWAG